MSADDVTARFGKRLAAARRSCGYTQEQLARLSDVSVGMVRDIEQGRRMPGFMVLFALVHALSCKAEELAGE